jgi:Ser/Thr protein kinase RdoA (MazF antagonist)
MSYDTQNRTIQKQGRSLKPIEQLTRLGKIRRQRAYARQALAQYPIEVRRADLIGTDTNLIYRVVTTDGKRYILRLAFPGWRTPENAMSEVLWLDALARDTDIPVPKIIRTRTGESMLRFSHEDATERRAVLMTWLPGTLLGKRLTDPNLFKMGELFGKLHLHGKTWQPPAGFAAQKFDRFMSRGEPDALFAEDQREVFTPHQWEVISRMRTRVDAAYAQLDPADLRVIHCDLWHDNIKLHKGELAPFDFEDTIWGYRIHDIAMAMLDLAEDAGVARYEELLPVFRAGYERHLPWPDGVLGVFQMGRVLWRLNWIARFQRKWLPNAVAFDTELFERFERTGKLSDPLRPR